MFHLLKNKNFTYKKRESEKVDIPRNLIDAKVQEYLANGGKITRIENITRSLQDIPNIYNEADDFLLNY